MKSPEQLWKECHTSEAFSVALQQRNDWRHCAGKLAHELVLWTDPQDISMTPNSNAALAEFERLKGQP